MYYIFNTSVKTKLRAALRMCGSLLQHGNGKSSPNIAHFCSFQIPGCNVFVLGFSQQLVSEVEVLDLQES